MNRIIKILVIMASINISFNYKSDTTIKGNANLITSENKVADFEKINISSNAEVHYHVSENFRIVVTIDENLAEYVEIVTENNILNVRTKKGSYSFTKFLVDIYSPTLNSISVTSAGSFISKDKITVPKLEISLSGSGKIKGLIECKSLLAKVSGAGKIHITGNSNKANIFISGSGKFNGTNFNINKANVDVSGSGSADIFVTDNLKANISGSGKINYQGEPKINTNIKGSGRIRKM